MLDFEIWGFTPFKFILSNISDASLWSSIFGLLIVVALLAFCHKMGLFNFIASVLCFMVVAVKTTIRASWFMVSQSYMMFMFHKDSRKNHYNSAEYWASRKLTVEGIKAIDSTGTQQLLIKHIKLVEYIVLGVLITKRVASNILYRVSTATKH